MPLAWLKRLAAPKATPKPMAPLVENFDIPAVKSTPCVSPEPERPVVCESPVAEPLEIPADKIAQRAYEKWVGRGCPHGTADQDWIEAEAELRAEFAACAPEPLPRQPR